MVAFLDGLVGRVREMLPVVSRAYHEGIVSEMSALHRQEINSTNDRVATLNDGFKAMSDDYSSRIGQLEKRLDEAKKANLRLYTELEDARAGLEDRSNRIFDLESRLNDWETAFSLVKNINGDPTLLRPYIDQLVEFYRLYVQAEKDLSVIRGELEALEEQFSRHGHVYDLSRYIGKEILVIGAEGNSSLREKLSSALADVGSLRFLDGESRSVSRLDKFSGVDYVVLILKGTKTHKITQRLGGLPVICSYGTNIFSVLSAMENYGRQAVISNH